MSYPITLAENSSPTLTTNDQAQNHNPSNTPIVASQDYITAGRHSLEGPGIIGAVGSGLSQAPTTKSEYCDISVNNNPTHSINQATHLASGSASNLNTNVATRELTVHLPLNYSTLNSNNVKLQLPTADIGSPFSSSHVKAIPNNIIYTSNDVNYGFSSTPNGPQLSGQIPHCRMLYSNNTYVNDTNNLPNNHLNPAYSTGDHTSTLSSSASSSIPVTLFNTSHVNYYGTINNSNQAGTGMFPANSLQSSGLLPMGNQPHSQPFNYSTNSPNTRVESGPGSQRQIQTSPTHHNLHNNMNHNSLYLSQPGIHNPLLFSLNNSNSLFEQPEPKKPVLMNAINFSEDKKASSVSSISSIESPVLANSQLLMNSNTIPSISGYSKRHSMKSKPAKPKFTPDDDTLLIHLKEDQKYTWKQIAKRFPGRTPGALQVRYCTRLKNKNVVWEQEDLNAMRDVLEQYERDKWSLISQRLGGKFSSQKCKDKWNQIQNGGNSLSDQEDGDANTDTGEELETDNILTKEED
ncbi:hypothetical protein NADFUDRAFT_48317 [Nadsonia fulvescens var. elongata DSM 6958]|uniref:Myb-like domain-containing protein n=1 Tax=Nadsonia fulvescens var. elongata DSM 6958 TaxID=857566 RepID=A0A1E3PCE6_9ASCO|nr:hypothetical protein NADFUDRAFT_48317 [Nadsonia fulvescens var. elongata DSM 6958]